MLTRGHFLHGVDEGESLPLLLLSPKINACLLLVKVRLMVEMERILASLMLSMSRDMLHTATTTSSVGPESNNSTVGLNLIIQSCVAIRNRSCIV